MRNGRPGPDRLTELGMQRMAPVAQVMVKQMLFMDQPQHRRVRGLASAAFTARRVEVLRSHIRDIANDLIDRVATRGEMDVMNDFANPLPAIVTAEMLGVPTKDHEQLKDWSAGVCADARQLPAQSGWYRRRAGGGRRT